VPVHIEVIFESLFVLFFKGSCELIDCVDLWVYEFIQIKKLPIEVFSTIASAEVSNYYSIGVHHRDYFEFIVFE
jgi:hypothetical protein